MCMKITFDSKDSAIGYAKGIKEAYRRKGMWKSGRSYNTTPYFCSNCQKWHLTSKSKLKGKRKKSHYTRLKAKTIEKQDT